MLTPSGISQATYLQALKSLNHTHARLTFIRQNVVFTDQDIEINGGIRLTSFFNADTELTFGKAVSQQITVTLLRSIKTDAVEWDDEIRLEFGVEINGSTYWVQVGLFTPEKPDRMRNDTIEFTARDRMARFDIIVDEFIQNKTFPCTLRELYNELCSYINIQNATGDEIPAQMDETIAENPWARGGGTCRDILAKIAEANCCYAKVNNAGKVVLCWFQDHVDDYELHETDYFDLDASEIAWYFGKRWKDLEPYTWDELSAFTWSSIGGEKVQNYISGVRLVKTDDDIGISVPDVIDSHVYLILDNPFLYGENNTEARERVTRVYDRVSSFGSYLPVTVPCVGNWLVEAGDVIGLEISTGEFVNFPIFNRTLVWNGACDDTYETTGTMERNSISNEIHAEMSNVGRYHRLVVDIDQLYSEIGDMSADVYSKIQQNATAISQEVTRATNREAGLLEKDPNYQDVNSIINKAINEADRAETNAKGASIAKTTQYQSAQAIVNAAVSIADSDTDGKLVNYSTVTQTNSLISQEVTRAKGVENGKIDKTNDYQTVNSIINKAINEADRAENNAKSASIAKTTQYQTATAIVNAAVSSSDTYTDNRLLNYSTSYQTSQEITQSVNQVKTDVLGQTYRTQAGLSIIPEGVKIWQNADYTGSNWLFCNSGAKYTRTGSGQDYTMGIGDYTNFTSTNGGILFNINNSGYGVIRMAACDRAGTYNAAVLLDCKSTTYGGFYPESVDPNAISLGTSTNVWYNSYLRHIYGKDGRIDLHPYGTHTSSSAYLMLQSSGPSMYLTARSSSDGEIYYSYIGQADAQWGYGYFRNVYVNGTAVTSSREKKHNIKPLQTTGEQIDQMAPVEFVYNDDKKAQKHFGFIWEDTADVIPEVCTRDEQGYKYMDYTSLIAVLLKEVQSLRQRVAELEAKVIME